MRKTVLLALTGSFCFAHSFAQTPVKLGDDNCGDTTKYSGVSKTTNHPADLKSVAYFFNSKKDSISFEIEVCATTSMSNDDFGFAFGIDRDMSQANGKKWRGSNSSFKYDYIYYVYRDHMYSIWFSDTDGGGSNPVPVGLTPGSASMIGVNNNQFRITFPMSKFDDDGNFNLVIGAGKNDITLNTSFNDDAPGTGYYTIGKSSGIQQVNTQRIDVYPNPANDMIHVNGFTSGSEFALYDINGRQLQQTILNAHNTSVNISTFSSGLYFYRIKDESGRELQTSKIFIEK